MYEERVLGIEVHTWQNISILNYGGIYRGSRYLNYGGYIGDRGTQKGIHLSCKLCACKRACDKILKSWLSVSLA